MKARWIVLLLVGALWPRTAASQPLVGFADMHTHPMSHLAFGGMILYGAPDLQATMLAGQRYRGYHIFEKNCWMENGTAGSLDAALGFDNQVHGAPGFGTTSFGDANNCGDVIRSAVIDELEEKYIFEAPNPGLAGEINDHPHRGYPDFTYWPHWSSVTHQQMYWEWIRRAYDGGLRVMVALALNNALLAKAANANQFIDDKASVELQLHEISAFVDHHSDFMRVVRTPEELRATVRDNRLAVVLGVETDDLGNLARRAASGERITQALVDAELQSLHDLGVRYVLPIHFSNNVFGGYAINRDLFALSSKEYTGNYPVVRESCGEGVHFELDPVNFDGIKADLLRSRDLGRIIDGQPDYPGPAAGCGHANSLGLLELGRGALRKMMSLGMMIDIDHMSRLAATEALGLAQQRDYPLSSGHNGMLADDCSSETPRDPQACTENKRTRDDYERIRRLGGMVGLGHGGKATSFVRGYRATLELMGNRALAIGTDVNGLEALPAPDPAAPVEYDASFPRYRFGNRTWDINSRLGPDGRELGDGFAHYGLFPDYIRSWRTSRNAAERMTDRSMEAFLSSAEGFARTWEKAKRRSAGAPRTANLTLRTGFCTQAGATLLYADINGDGADDLLCRDPARLGVDYTDGRGVLAGTSDWSVDTHWCTHAGAKLYVADVNGDRRADLICHDRNRVWVNYADQYGHYRDGTDWFVDTSWCVHSGAALQLADVNGDGRADLFCRDPGRIWVNYADSSGHYGSGTDWFVDTHWCTHEGATFQLADLNGDGRTDLFCRSAGGRLWASYADGDGHYRDATDWFLDTTWCTHTGATLRLGDFNGDGRADLLCRDPGRLWINYARAPGQFDGHTDWFRGTTWCGASSAVLARADLNGDGRDDLVCRDGSALELDYASFTPREGEFER